MEENNNHSYRMYCFVERHLSALDKGIQLAHSIVEYGNIKDKSDEYSIWSHRDKTIIALNGGTVNDLKQLEIDLTKNGICHSIFLEEDLNNAITCISVLVDDRVFDRTRYPNFLESGGPDVLTFCLMATKEKYEQWLKNIGGEKNRYLRELLEKYHLAR